MSTVCFLLETKCISQTLSHVRSFIIKGKKGRVLPPLSRHGDAAEAVQASGPQPSPENAEGGFSAAVYSAGGGLFY